MSTAHPSQYRMSESDAYRVNRVLLATLLHKMPSEIDAAPAQDIEDVIAVNNFMDEQKAAK